MKRTFTPEAAAAEVVRLRRMVRAAPHGLRTKRRIRLVAAVAQQLRAEVRQSKLRGRA
jgi:hypothetical protein